MKILLSGKPGVGKSTLLEKLLTRYKTHNKKVLGCIVHEMKDNQKRYGFTMRYIPSEKETILASCNDVLSPYYISKFSVNIDGIENELIPFMSEMRSSKTASVLIFDEIGRMQNLSHLFIPAVDLLMTAELPLIATVVYDDEIWARKYKDDNACFYIVLTENNRDVLPELLESMLDSLQDFKKLKLHILPAVFSLFNRYMKNGQFPELLKMFKRTIKYLAHSKACYDVQQNSYAVFGNSAIRTVQLTESGDYSCTCTFHKIGKEQGNLARECSHIQTVLLLETNSPV